MLATLGFFIAALVALIALPHYRRRTARLTTEELKRSMPLTEAEIRADKDRLRAEYSIRIHQLESSVERGSLAAARQKVEINRRDAAISALEGELTGLRTSLDEHENARRVLEHTIMDRLPRVEQRLSQAKRLLFQRDREIAHLTETAEKQAQALEEATQINTQSRDEVHRLTAALATRAARGRDGMGDSRFDGEVALRSEIEALRAKTRDQAALIGRLQGLMARSGVAITGRQTPVVAGSNGSLSGATEGDGGSILGITRGGEEEIKRLRQDLAEAEEALRSLRGSAAAGQAGVSSLQSELESVNAKTRDQAEEIAKLKAALKTYQVAEEDNKGVAESKLALKAQLSSVKAQVDEQTVTIQKLRAEVAKSNERLARQGAHFMEEMRRLGGGTLQTSSVSRRRTSMGEGGVVGGATTTLGRRSLSERISAPRAPANDRTASGVGAGNANSSAEQGKARRSLFARAVEKVGASGAAGGSVATAGGEGDSLTGTAGDGGDSRVSGFLRALDGSRHASSPEVDNSAVAPSDTDDTAGQRTQDTKSARKSKTSNAKSDVKGLAEADAVSGAEAEKTNGAVAASRGDSGDGAGEHEQDQAAARPGGLLERITRLDRSGKS